MTLTVIGLHTKRPLILRIIMCQEFERVMSAALRFDVLTANTERSSRTPVKNDSVDRDVGAF